MTDQAPTLSRNSAALLSKLIETVSLPVSHPQLAEVAALWTEAIKELTAIIEYHNEDCDNG